MFVYIKGKRRIKNIFFWENNFREKNSIIGKSRKGIWCIGKRKHDLKIG